MVTIKKVFLFFAIFLFLFISVFGALALGEINVNSHSKPINVLAGSGSDFWGMYIKFHYTDFNVTLLNFTVRGSNPTKAYVILAGTAGVYPAIYNSTTYIDINASDRVFMFNVSLNTSFNYIFGMDSEGANFNHYWSNQIYGYPVSAPNLNFTVFSGCYYYYADSRCRTASNWYNITDRWNGITDIVILNKTISTQPITLINQTPSDVTDTSIFSSNLFLFYNYYNNTYLKNAYMNYSIKSAVLNCVQFINGTCQRYNNTLYYVNPFSVTNINSTNLVYGFELGENNIYPYSTNYDYENISLNNYRYFELEDGEYLADEILNISNVTKYNIYEVPLTTTARARIYYYNSSYDFNSNPTTNANVVLIYDQVAPAYNHTHNYGLGHILVPYSVVNGHINGVIVNGGGFLIRGAQGGIAINFTNQSAIRPTATRWTENNGNDWLELGTSSFLGGKGFTILSRVYFFNGDDNITYAPFLNYTNNSYFNLAYVVDNLNITPFAPTPPQILVPNNTNFFNQYINIQYRNTTANSLGASILKYSIDVYKQQGGTLTYFKSITQNNSLNLFYNWNAYLSTMPVTINGTGFSTPAYYIAVTATDTNGQNATTYEVFNLNYTTPHLSIISNFTTPNALNATPNASIYYICNNSISENATLYVTFNGNVLYNKNVSSGISILNSTLLRDATNTLYVNCSDFLESTTQTTAYRVYVKEICLIDELDNALFKPNIIRARVYFDDNSTLYDFKLNNRSCVNYTSNVNNNKLRFDLAYTSSVVTRYIDPSYLPDNSNKLRVCANKEGVTHYEQLLISVTNTPVVMKSVYSDCYVVADSTRFAYQDAYLLKAYTIEALYYLYKIIDNVQVFLASIDGSIATYINLDNLEFRQNVYNLNILTDAITFEQLANNVTQIYYNNLRGDNIAANITITRLDTNVIVYSETTFSNYNEITILFDYTTLGVNQSTIFKINGIFTKNDGTTSTIIQYFTPSGASGNISSGLAFTISFLLMIFGLTLTSTRITFGYFGLFVILLALGVLSFAVGTWYITFLVAMELISLIYIILIMVLGSGDSIRGGVA